MSDIQQPIIPTAAESDPIFGAWLLGNPLSGYELLSNKATDFSTVDNTKYPSVQAVKTYVDALVIGLLDYRGGHNASGNTFPTTGGSGTAGAVLKGDMWVISNAGTLGGQAVQVGDSIIANVDTPGQTLSNWNILNSNIPYIPFNIDQTTPQTIINGKPTFDEGLDSNNNITIKSNFKLYLDG